MIADNRIAVDVAPERRSARVAQEYWCRVSLPRSKATARQGAKRLQKTRGTVLPAAGTHLPGERFFALMAFIAADRRTDKNNLSMLHSRLSFAPYAEIDCSQQNTQISGKTFQDHRARQSAKGAIVAPAFAFGQECETETPTGQNSTSGCYRCRPRQGKPAVRLTAIAQLNRVTARPLFRWCAWSSRSLFL